MISISDAVRQELSQNPLITEFLSSGLLNTAEYARLIQSKIEKECFKKVEIGSIVTSLSRIKSEFELGKSLEPLIISDIQLKYPISDLVFPQSDDQSAKLAALYQLKNKEYKNDFLNVTSSVSEVNIFCSSILNDKILEIFGSSNLIYQKHDLSAITIKLGKNYIESPGITYQLLRALVLNSITLVETVTTFMETTIFISREDTQKTIEVLTKNFLKKP